MNYPYWEYNKKERELSVYFGEYNYVMYYDEEAELLYKDLEFGRPKDREFILNEIYLMKENDDPYRRSGDLI